MKTTKEGKRFAECLANISQQTKYQVGWSFDIATKIDNALKEQGITQKEFARRIGKRESEVSKWLCGTHNFTLSTLALISDALRIPLINV